MNQRPVAIGLLLCEQVIIEERTRNVTPVNCFTHRVLRRFPSEPFPFTVFAVLTDGRGKMPLDIVVERLDDLERFIGGPCRISSWILCKSSASFSGVGIVLSPSPGNMRFPYSLTAR